MKIKYTMQDNDTKCTIHEYVEVAEDACETVYPKIQNSHLNDAMSEHVNKKISLL